MILKRFIILTIYRENLFLIDLAKMAEIHKFGLALEFFARLANGYMATLT